MRSNRNLREQSLVWHELTVRKSVSLSRSVMRHIRVAYTDGPTKSEGHIGSRYRPLRPSWCRGIHRVGEFLLGRIQADRFSRVASRRICHEGGPRFNGCQFTLPSPICVLLRDCFSQSDLHMAPITMPTESDAQAISTVILGLLFSISRCVPPVERCAQFVVRIG